MPFFDSAATELFLGAPARVRSRPNRTKAFLRSAAAPWLPPQVVEATKSIGFDRKAQLRSLVEGDWANDLLDKAGGSPAVCDRVDLPLARQHLKAAKAGSRTDAEQLHALLGFLGWYRRLALEYGFA